MEKRIVMNRLSLNITVLNIKINVSYSIYIPNDRPLDTDVLCGSFLTGL